MYYYKFINWQIPVLPCSLTLPVALERKIIDWVTVFLNYSTKAVGVLNAFFFSAELFFLRFKVLARGTIFLKERKIQHATLH